MPPPIPRSKKKKDVDPSQVDPNGIVVHAWNKDCTMVALSPNNDEVHIYETNGARSPGKWKKKPSHILREHTELVSGIDWCHATDMLVTCAHDRNAYVWEYCTKDEDGDYKNKWKPSLCISRINRAATSVKWSPAGNKFAITSAAKVVPICYYESSNNWWVSKALRKHKSTVLSVAWCHNNKFVVTGGTDYRCRVMSAYMSKLDSEEDDGFGEIWKKQHEFGEVLAEFDATGSAWVHSVAWSPSGFRLAFTGHGSTIHFVQIVGDGKPIVQSYSHKKLPFLSCEFVSDGAVVACGFDMNPTVFLAEGDESEPTWKLAGLLDKEEKAVEKKQSATEAARNRFRNLASKGQDTKGKGSGKVRLNTKHQNYICGIACFRDENGVSQNITTIGLDGRVIKWNLEKCGFKI